MQPFNYAEAFSRNLGWLTTAEQDKLRNSRIAIAGLGGVGGSHLLALTRLGVGGFNIADFDVFDLPNFNRQAGAAVSTLGSPKAQTMARQARDINPELQLRIFPDGVSKQNLTDFLDGVDLYVDGLDFFAFETRRAMFSACRAANVPAITVAPLGMGAALLNFTPDGMSFEEYFAFDDCRTDVDFALHFLIGLSPSMLQMGYLADSSRVDLAGHKGPSTVIATQLCAGVATGEALKILLGRGKLYVAPWSLHFDSYRSRLRRTWRPGGNRNPLQKLMIYLARKRLESGFGPDEAGK